MDQSQITVLLIDDDFVDRTNVSRTLGTSASFVKVVEAEDLEEAVELAKSREFDISILDLTLGKTSGLDTLYEYKKLLGELPVLVLSGVANEKMAIEAIEIGALDFIQKDGLSKNWLMITLRNAIHRHQLQKGVRRHMADLEQFAHAASHDLIEPLRSIAGFSQLLRHRSEDKFDEVDLGYLKHIDEGANRLKSLIEDLLSYSRTSNENRSFSKVCLETCVAEAKQNLNALIEDSGALVQLSELPSVHGCHSQLVQLFQNLLGNGIKYRSDLLPVIRIDAKPVGSKIAVTVCDNGIGIEPRHHQQIFGLFKRLHRREEYPGTGLGLAICRKIVERHGGKITVDSAKGHGTTFTILFRRIFDT